MRWFFVCTYLPVAIATRLAVEEDVLSVWACWNSVPCAASRSNAGVFVIGWPYVPSDSARTASGRKSRKFLPEGDAGGGGGCGGGPGLGLGARPDTPEAQSLAWLTPATVEKRKQCATPDSFFPPQCVNDAQSAVEQHSAQHSARVVCESAPIRLCEFA